jgi:hypothetical protein
VEEQQRQRPSFFLHSWVTTQHIQTIANDIFERKGRGITFRDLISGKHKCVDSAKQAQNILYYHKKRGTLCTSSHHRTRPRQYYLSAQDAEEAVINYKKRNNNNDLLNKSSTHNHLTGVKHSIMATDLEEKMSTTLVEDKKADNLAEVIDRIAEHTHGELPVGLHNIRIHLDLPKEYAKETYYERLHYIKSSGTREKAKKVEALIDGFKLQLLFYPNNKVVIMVPCSDRPFPISLDSPDRLTSDFISFVAQIRRVIVSYLSDMRGRIVPPIHHPSWRLIHADMNWDVPATMLNYLGMDGGIQVIKAGEAVLRVYRKRLKNGERFIRVEEGVHLFRSASSSFNWSIGQTIVEAAIGARKKLRTMKGNNSNEVS